MKTLLVILTINTFRSQAQIAAAGYKLEPKYFGE